LWRSIALNLLIWSTPRSPSTVAAWQAATPEFEVASVAKDGIGGGVTPVVDGPTVEPSMPAPDLLKALRQQLGLRLVSAKELTDLLVVDGYNKTPTGN
jgi:hypothetical protein